MAIKGKKRTRGGRARVAAPPRPVLVTPKKPLFRRLWFRLLLVGILVGLVATAGFFFWQERREGAELEAAQAEVAQLGAAIEGALIGVANPAGGDMIVLPEVSQALIQLQTGEARERRIRRQVEEWETSLERADSSLAAIRTDRAEARQAIARMRQGLAQFSALVAKVPPMLEIEREEARQEAAIEIVTEHEEASSTFGSGWLIFLTLRAEVGLDQPAAPPDPNQVPPGFDPNQQPPPGFDPSQIPGFDPNQQPPPGFDPSQLPGVEQAPGTER